MAVVVGEEGGAVEVEEVGDEDVVFLWVDIVEEDREGFGLPFYLFAGRAEVAEAELEW